EEIAEQAFLAARARISSEFSKSERDGIFGSQLVSMSDFILTLEDVRSKYESRKQCKAYVWLEKLSSRVVYYGNVLDVLVQHHPEYVSLVWGAFKLLFMSVLSHEEMVRNLAKACSNIADVLPRSNLSLILYPTAAMREAVARLYAAIIQFVVRSVTWYGQSRIKHMLTSITKPWGLSWESEACEVEQHARNVDKLAQSGSRAELREAHLQIHQVRSELQATRAEIKVLATNHSLQIRISNDLTSSKTMISHIQLGQILSLPFMQTLPTSGQSFEYCRSMRLRRARLLIPPINANSGPAGLALEKLTAQRRPTFLVLDQDYSHARCVKDFLFDMIGFLRQHGLPVLWVLRSSGMYNSSFTSLDVIRMLLHQALEINGSAMSTSYPITVAQLREASSHQDWFALLKRALQGCPRIYIIMDSDAIEHVTNHDKATATK
ncbi:hypothetical protein V8F33_001872, partial [Rhypophila sp. PSN 637]